MTKNLFGAPRRVYSVQEIVSLFFYVQELQVIIHVQEAESRHFYVREAVLRPGLKG